MPATINHFKISIMQPKFTQKSLGFLCLKNLAIALIFIASSQLSFAQPVKEKQATAVGKAALRLKAIERNSSGAGVNADNDAGLPNRVSLSMNRTEAICTTFTGSLGPGDPTLAGNRFFRDGVASTCAAPKAACPGLSAPSGCFYDMYTWTNPIGSAQCVTITFTNNTTGFVNFISAYIGAPNPANICANYLADIGGSPALGTPGVFSFTAPGGATIGFLVTSVAAGTPSNYSFTLDAAICSGTPCSGTPNPGNTVSSANTVCPTVPFTLSFATPQNFAGIVYQWQTAPAVGGPWTNAPGASTGGTYTTSITTATAFRAIVTCTNGGGSATSNPLLVNVNTPSACYCAAGATALIDEKISRVRFNTIDNASTSTAGYENFTTISTDVVQGAVIPMTVDISNFFAGDLVRVWIDLNQNGNFTDPGERVLATTLSANPSVGNITIPLASTLGPTRMRVRMYWQPNDPDPGPCGNTGFGQVEDYTVNIQPCIQGVFTTQPASTSAQCASNATFTVAATGSALSYSWEYRINASSPWLNVPNAAPYSGVTTNTLTIANVSSAMTGYQYRALMSGPCTAIDASAVATLTVTPLVAAVSPVSATICVGSIQQLTLTNASSPVTQTFTATTGLPLAIPDATLAGINNSIPVTLPALSIISNINVKFSIPAHTWPGDLVIVLRAPNGKVLNLDYGISSTGAGPGAGMVNTVITATAGAPLLSSTTAPYTGTFRPDAQMTPTASMGNAPVGPTGFNAAADLVNNFTALYTQTNGNWTLAIYDAFGGDVGSLTAWSMDITYGAPAAGVWTASPATPNTMFINAGATTPYVAGSLANTIWVNPTVNTSYSVVYSTPTPCTSAPTVIPVTVVSPVSAVVNPVNRAACVGGSTTFSVSATGGPLTYQWQVTTDGGVNWTNIAGATSATYTVTNVTTAMHNYRYRAVITAAPCVGSTTTTAATLTVNSLPVVTLSAPDLALTPGQLTTITGTSSPAAVNWSWTLNGAAISGTANTQVVGIDGLGTYQARVTDANGCINTSGVLTIGAEAALDRLWIYPNPNDGVFQVRLYYGGPLTERRVVSIFKSNGQLVMEKEFTLDNITNPYLRMDFDLSTQAGGTYVVKVYNRHTGKTVSGLVVIQ